MCMRQQGERGRPSGQGGGGRPWSLLTRGLGLCPPAGPGESGRRQPSE